MRLENRTVSLRDWRPALRAAADVGEQRLQLRDLVTILGAVPRRRERYGSISGKLGTRGRAARKDRCRRRSQPSRAGNRRPREPRCGSDQRSSAPRATAALRGAAPRSSIPTRSPICAPMPTVVPGSVDRRLSREKEEINHQWSTAIRLDPEKNGVVASRRSRPRPVSRRKPFPRLQRSELCRDPANSPIAGASWG